MAGKAPSTRCLREQVYGKALENASSNPRILLEHGMNAKKGGIPAGREHRNARKVMVAEGCRRYRTPAQAALSTGELSSPQALKVRALSSTMSPCMRNVLTLPLFRT